MVFTAETLCATRDTAYFVEEIFAYKPPAEIRNAARDAARRAAGVRSVSDAKSGGGDSGSDGEDQDDDEHECTICMCAPSSIALLPCRHCCVCPDCFERLQACPICRAEFGSHVELPFKPEEDDISADGGLGFAAGGMISIGAVAGVRPGAAGAGGSEPTPSASARSG